MAKPKIFVSWPDYSPDDAETGRRLVKAGYDIALYPRTGNRTAEELSRLLGEAVGAIVSTDPFTAQLIARHPQLRVISRIGVGTDSIDRAAASAYGVAIAITPGANTNSVADHTLALMLALVRKVVTQDRLVKAGRWDRIGIHAPSELFGKVVGLVGGGGIAKAVAKRLTGFDTETIFYDPNVEEVVGATRAASLAELLAASDIISLHVPLLPETHELINELSIGRMKPGALIVNTARGSLIKEDALFHALRSGQLGGAALDVFCEEPPMAPKIAEAPNLICSSHIAGLSREAVRRMTIMATASVISVLAGDVPATVINPESIAARSFRNRDQS